MIDESTVNSQIVDSVNQLVSGVLGQGPGQSASLVDAVMANTLGITMHNAAAAQRNAQVITNASVASACAKMLQAQIHYPPPAPPEDKPISPLVPGSLDDRNTKDFRTAQRGITNLKNDQTEAQGDVDEANKKIDTLKGELCDQPTKPSGTKSQSQVRN